MTEYRYTILQDPDRDGARTASDSATDPSGRPLHPMLPPEEQIGDMIAMARPDLAVPGKTVFLIGAGCSITAGVPSVDGVAQRMVREVARRLCGAGDSEAPDDCYKRLVDRGKMNPAGDPINWHLVYDEMFRRHYTAPDDIRNLFSELVDEAKGAINWAHLILGELVAQRYVSTVLTTNFDQLVLAGMVRAGVIPVVSDGIESLNRISSQPRHPQLIEIHGSRHTYQLRNQPDEVAEVAANPQAGASITGLLQAATTFVVVGYGGRERGVMDLLIRAAQANPNKNLIWIAHSADPIRLSERAQAFLNTGRNSYLLPGRDADTFFFNLARALRIGSPSSVREPLQLARRWLAELAASAGQSADISKEIAAAQRRLEAGERSMAEAAPDVVAQARELRLGGRTRAAWDLLRAEGGGSFDEAKAIGEDFLEELFQSAHDLFEREADADAGNYVIAYWKWRASNAADSDARGDAWHGLGRALLTTGERVGGIGPLEEALTAFTKAAKERSRKRAPLKWASTQNYIGNALSRLGEHEGGPERLDGAVAAYRAALEERTRDRVPLEWAMTQNNLGNALSRLGERDSGTGRLELAVEAYRAALEERTRERVPLGWAMTQNNLGTALSTLGERESGTGRLEEAVVAYRAALEEHTRERVPLGWAMAQNNLGTALKALGARESGTGRLEEAVAAYRAALEERTRERVPLDWAMTLNNLGNALKDLGKRENGTGRLEEAVAAYRAALEERTRERVPLRWAMTQNNLGNALRTHGERESGTGRLEEAVAAYRAALEEYTRERVPLDWAITTSNLAETQALIAQRTGDCGLARAAVADLEEVVGVFEAAAHEPNTAHYREVLGRARAVVAEVCGAGDAG